MGIFAVAAHARCPHYARLGIIWLHPLPLKLTEDWKNEQTNQPRKKKKKTRRSGKAMACRGTPVT